MARNNAMARVSLQAAVVMIGDPVVSYTASLKVCSALLELTPLCDLVPFIESFKKSYELSAKDRELV